MAKAGTVEAREKEKIGIPKAAEKDGMAAKEKAIKDCTTSIS